MSSENPVKKRKRKYKPHLNVKRIKAKIIEKSLDSVDLHDEDEDRDKQPPPTCIEIYKKRCDNDSSSMADKTPSRLIRELKQLNKDPRDQKIKNIVSPIDDVETTPKNGNRLIDISSLIDLIEKNTLCRSCGSTLKVTEETVGIATSVELFCLKYNMRKKNGMYENQNERDNK